MRDELNRFDTRTADQTVLVETRQELLDLVGGFLPESSDQIRDVKKIDSAIEQLSGLGYIRRLGGETSEAFEIRLTTWCRFGPGRAGSRQTTPDRPCQHLSSTLVRRAPVLAGGCTAWRC